MHVLHWTTQPGESSMNAASTLRRLHARFFVHTNLDYAAKAMLQLLRSAQVRNRHIAQTIITRVNMCPAHAHAH
eukprot:6191159-Pleurochrysis_carterae.AAC.1